MSSAFAFEGDTGDVEKLRGPRAACTVDNENTAVPTVANQENKLANVSPRGETESLELRDRIHRLESKTEVRNKKRRKIEKSVSKRGTKKLTIFCSVSLAISVSLNER